MPHCWKFQIAAHLLNSLRKMAHIYLFSSTRLINSIKHEHSCEIPSIFQLRQQALMKYVNSLRAYTQKPTSNLYIETRNADYHHLYIGRTEQGGNFLKSLNPTTTWTVSGDATSLVTSEICGPFQCQWKWQVRSYLRWMHSMYYKDCYAVGAEFIN